MAKRATKTNSSTDTTSKSVAEGAAGADVDRAEDEQVDEEAVDPSVEVEAVEVEDDEAEEDDSESDAADEAAEVPVEEDEDGPRTPPPEGVGLVLIVGPPRCGTTVIMDWIRMHPYARIERSGGLFNLLIRGSHNRYPRDLTVQSGGIRIEQRPGKIVRVPGFDRKEDQNKGGWMVEKIHPHFFLFESDWLMKRLEGLEKRGVPIRLVLRGRSPEQFVRSEWFYKRRVENWQAWLADEEIASFAVRSLKTMSELIERRPGGIVSRFEDDGEDPTETIIGLYKEIWPDQDEEERAARAAEVAKITSIARRGRHAEKRFTANDPVDDETTRAVEALTKAHKKEIAEATKIYQKAFGS